MGGYANLQVGTATMSTLNIGGTAVTTTAAELNLIDGGTARGTTAIADGDGVLINDGGTMRMTTVETLAAYLDDEITAMPNLTSVGTLTTLTIDNIIINGTNIGHTSDTDAIAIASDGVVTMNQIPVFSAGINVSGGTIAGTLATAAQTNITSLGTLTGLTVNGATVFNENSADVDFRIESNNKTHMFFVDAGNNKIGINTDTPDLPLHVTAGGTGASSAQNALRLEAHTTNTAAVGFGVGIQLEAENAQGAVEMVGEIQALYTDQTSTAEDSKFIIKTLVAGSSAETLQIAGGYVAFKDGSASNPSITNIGDENTGLYFPAADMVGVSIGGTAKAMFGVSSGRTFQWSQHGINSHYYDLSLIHI